MDLSFTLQETGAIRGFAIIARNRYGVEIGELLVDFPLTVEDWRDDGIGQTVRFEFDGVYFGHSCVSQSTFQRPYPRKAEKPKPLQKLAGV